MYICVTKDKRKVSLHPIDFHEQMKAGLIEKVLQEPKLYVVEDKLSEKDKTAKAESIEEKTLKLKEGIGGESIKAKSDAAVEKSADEPVAVKSNVKVVGAKKNK